MSARMQIDPEPTGTSLAASAQTRSAAIAGTDITLPQGLYVGATNALAAGFIAASLADLEGRVIAGAAAAASSVAAYQATEQANAATLRT